MKLHLILVVAIFSLKGFAKGTDWEYRVGLSHSIGANTKYENIQYTDGTNSLLGKGEVTYEDGLSFDFESRNLKPNSWGFLGGLTYDLTRKEKRAVVNFGNVTVNSEVGGNLQMTFLYGSAAYRWNEFYLPFGLNYNIVNYKSEGTTTTGGIGAQLGFGYYINEEFLFELLSRSASLNQKSTDPNGSSVDFGAAYFTSLMLSIKRKI